LSGALILAAYGVLVWQAGWWGLLAIPTHVAIMLLAVPRKHCTRCRVPGGGIKPNE